MTIEYEHDPKTGNVIVSQHSMLELLNELKLLRANLTRVQMSNTELLMENRALKRRMKEDERDKE